MPHSKKYEIRYYRVSEKNRLSKPPVHTLIVEAASKKKALAAAASDHRIILGGKHIADDVEAIEPVQAKAPQADPESTKPIEAIIEEVKTVVAAQANGTEIANALFFNDPDENYVIPGDDEDGEDGDDLLGEAAQTVTTATLESLDPFSDLLTVENAPAPANGGEELTPAQQRAVAERLARLQERRSKEANGETVEVATKGEDEMTDAEWLGNLEDLLDSVKKSLESRRETYESLIAEMHEASEKVCAVRILNIEQRQQLENLKLRVPAYEKVDEILLADYGDAIKPQLALFTDLTESFNDLDVEIKENGADIKGLEAQVGAVFEKLAKVSEEIVVLEQIEADLEGYRDSLEEDDEDENLDEDEESCDGCPVREECEALNAEQTDQSNEPEVRTNWTFPVGLVFTISVILLIAAKPGIPIFALVALSITAIVTGAYLLSRLVKYLVP